MVMRGAYGLRGVQQPPSHRAAHGAHSLRGGWEKKWSDFARRNTSSKFQQKITKEAYRSRSQTSFKRIRGRFPEGQKSPSRLRIVRAALLIILELLLGIAQLDRVQYIPQNVEQTQHRMESVPSSSCSCSGCSSSSSSSTCFCPSSCNINHRGMHSTSRCAFAHFNCVATNNRAP